MQHSGFVRFNDAPVVDSFDHKGRVILTSCRRNLSDAIRDMKLLVEILPQKDIAFQEVTHGNDMRGCRCRLSTVCAGNAGCVDGVKFVRVGETKVRSHTAYVYGIVECQRTQLELLNDMAKLAKECGRLYRIGRRTEVMEAFEAWQRLSNEFRQNAQNGQI